MNKMLAEAERELFGYDWYHFLKENKNSLTERIPWYDRKFVVARTNEYNGVENYVYKAFDSAAVFYRMYREIIKKNPENKTICFHEVIFGNNFQRPKFDIDITFEKDEPIKEMEDGWKIVEWLVNQIIGVLKEKGINININDDIYLYSSCKENVKFSVHLVMPKYYHFNYKEAKAFYDAVLNYSTDENKHSIDYRKYIDPSVYSSVRNFRLLYSTKYGQVRHKKRVYEWEIKNEWSYLKPQAIIYPKEGELAEFENSLITFVYDCVSFPSFVSDEDEDKEYNTVMQKEGDIKLICSMFDRKAFSVENVNWPFISLKRHRSTHCDICNRSHENENPYIFVTENTGKRCVYFNCRRDNDNRSSFLGYLENEDDIVVETIIEDSDKNDYSDNVDNYIEEIVNKPKKEKKSFIGAPMKRKEVKTDYVSMADRIERNKLNKYYN